jgi:hypothetical protein
MKFFQKIFLFFALIISFSSNPIAQVLQFQTGEIRVRVDSFGAIRLYTAAGIDTIWQLERISILVGGNEFQVMDYYQDIEIEIPNAIDTLSTADFEIVGTYNNEFSFLPPDVLVRQHVYGWEGSSYFLIKAVVTNRDSVSVPIKYGLDIVTRIDGTYEEDHIYLDDINEMVVASENSFVGFKSLSIPLLSASIFNWFYEYPDSDSAYYNWLTSGSKTDSIFTDENGGVIIMGTPPHTLLPGDSATYYFAVAIGSNETRMVASMNEAEQRYISITSVEDNDQNVPLSYNLKQNFPNPFNPNTTISFSIPTTENISLKIFNILGQEVEELAKGEFEPGTYVFNFNGADLTSGVYFYTITAGDFKATKKMVLLK